VATLLVATAALHAAASQAVVLGGDDVVIVDAAVTSRNKIVTGLTAADFEITDNGVKQTILDVTRESMPIDVTLALDTSASVGSRLSAALLNAAEKVRRQLRAGDRVAMVTFNQQIRERVALAPAEQVQSISLGPPGGGTSLFDTIGIALATPPNAERRQMVIVFTDGLDTMSFLDEATVLDVGRRSRAAVFVVAAEPPGSRLPKAFFDRLAETTGGLVEIVPAFEVASTSAPSGGVSSIVIRPATEVLNEAFLRALENFRTSYVIRYPISGVARPGWHALTVRVTKPNTNYQIRARKGYTAK
jgi:VWFA-related protein